MSGDGWHRVEPVEVPDDGRVRSVVVGGRTVALARCGARLGARWTTATRTRAARWTRARSRTARPMRELGDADPAQVLAFFAEGRHT